MDGLTTTQQPEAICSGPHHSENFHGVLSVPVEPQPNEDKNLNLGQLNNLKLTVIDNARASSKKLTQSDSVLLSSGNLIKTIRTKGSPR